MLYGRRPSVRNCCRHLGKTREDDGKGQGNSLLVLNLQVYSFLLRGSVIVARLLIRCNVQLGYYTLSLKVSVLGRVFPKRFSKPAMIEIGAGHGWNARYCVLEGGMIPFGCKYIQSRAGFLRQTRYC